MNTSFIHDQFQSSINRYILDSASHQCQYPSKHQSKSLTNSNKKRLARKADSLSQRVQEHVRVGANISKTIKRTLSLGAQILQMGGVEKVFTQYFSVTEGERLSKVSQCYLSTTSGPLAGLLFISNEKVAFCSERSIKVFNQKGQMRRIRYKVAIPLKNIKCVNQSQNVEKPTQKYIKIVTEDGFDFWLMGVLKYQKTFKYLEQAISQSRVDEYNKSTISA
ncbi:putative GEM-like protein 8 isoform X2 [Medicago truncatula]|uniref:putative GEM-like protein 8 isoform X2 n=1 Tax=Medicago truncatula TaxID=3880 RepID=UPI001968366C|nr:putative GEM-like protein 8 isoform X2 [Medicago truncatula]